MAGRTATKASALAGRILKGVASLVLGVLGLIAVLLVLLGIFARPGADGVSKVAGKPILTVLSGSMRPVFDPGDLIVDSPLTHEQRARLAAGNIITFHINNTPMSNLITHRIVAVNHADDGTVTYQTKGDANNATDLTPVSPEQIVGVYSRHLPLGGYLLQAAQNKSIFMIIIAVPLIFLVVITIARYWNEPGNNENAADGEGGNTSSAPSEASVTVLESESVAESSAPVAAGVSGARHQYRHERQPESALLLTPSGDGSEREGGQASV